MYSSGRCSGEPLGRNKVAWIDSVSLDDVLLHGTLMVVSLALQNVSHWLALPILSAQGFSFTKLPQNRTPPV